MYLHILSLVVWTITRGYVFLILSKCEDQNIPGQRGKKGMGKILEKNCRLCCLCKLSRLHRFVCISFLLVMLL